MELIWPQLNSEQKGVLMKPEPRAEESLPRRSVMSPKSRKYAGERNSMASSEMYERMIHNLQLSELKTQKKKY